MNGSNLNCKEIKIPVPWGHIAAKEWGNPSSTHHILGVHGWQDSAASFDLLIPLLSPALHIVVVDLPGHGLSSHRPTGVPYHIFDWVVDLHRVIEHLKWDKFSLLGHSMGFGLSLSYAACFPEKVLKVLGLDHITPFIMTFILTPEDLAGRMADGIRQLLQAEQASTRAPRPVSFDTAVQVVVDTLQGSMTKEGAIVQMKRGITHVGNTGMVIINRDPRVRMNYNPGIELAQLKALAKNIRCEVLVLAADRGPVLGFESACTTPEEVEELVDIYRRKAKSFKVISVAGTHHVHLNDPGVVAPHINEFFKKF